MSRDLTHAQFHARLARLGTWTLTFGVDGLPRFSGLWGTVVVPGVVVATGERMTWKLDRRATLAAISTAVARATATVKVGGTR